MTKEITIRKSAVMLPTAIKATRTNETVILDFMNEEFIGDETKYISFSSIALTRTQAIDVQRIINNFIKKENNNEK